MENVPLYSSRIIGMFLAFVRSRHRHVNVDDVLAAARILPYEVSDPGHWFSQEQINRFYEKLVEATGDRHLARHVGQAATSAESLGFLRKYVLGMIGPGNVFSSVSRSCRTLARSAEYDMVRLADNRVQIKVTPLPGIEEQPFQCENRLGIFESIVRTFEFDVPEIEHPECVFKGGAACRYLISWNASPLQKIRAARNYGALVFALAGAALLFVGQLAAAFWLLFIGVLSLSLLSYVMLRMEKFRLEAAFSSLKESADELVEQININYNNALLVNEIGQAISMQTNVDVVLAEIIQALEKRLAYDRCLIMLADDDTRRLKFRIGFGYSEEELQEWNRTSFDLDAPGSDSIFTRAFREQKSVLTGSDDGGGGHDRPQLCCPIVIKGRSLGVLGVENIQAGKPLVQSDLSLMMGIASVIGVSIRNAAYIEHEKLITEQLLHSQKLESIGQLSGGLAHDLNNILCVISGYAMLHRMNTIQTPDQARYVGEIQAATDRASQLVQSLLAYSRRQTMQQKRLDLNHLVQNIASFISRIISAEIELELSLADVPVVVLVDPVQIEQVLLNLAANARDAMPAGGCLRISVGTEHIDEVASTRFEEIPPGGYASIVVSDNGTGMNEETRRRIFDPFYTTKEVGKGTGLGLSVSMGIITQHGGHIDVHSTPGAGSDFKLFLPLHHGADVEADAPSSPVDVPATGSGTILIAEDHPKILSFMEELLTNAGYRVITATNGQEAVERFSTHADDIALVISDMVMPLKSGRKACDEIRQLREEVKFLFISGYTQENTGRAVDHTGGDDLIAKPIKALELLSKTRELIGGLTTDAAAGRR